ncbi:MAG: T9SS type A sorting domain-containing protein [Bacteroidales bacterium]|nr:T9SS type A sorting domain-containing protein [Bacteroidales bacterium]
MKTLKNLLCIVLFISCNQVFSQIWPKTYFIDFPNFPYNVIETYDKGYLIGGQLFHWDGTISDGFIYKTSINGEILWHKTLYQNFEGTSVFDINQTTDGGYIVAGSTDKYDSWGDPFIMKLNACGENEWCRIYTFTKNDFDYATSIYPIPGGYIAHIYKTGYLDDNDHVFLFRLNENGDLLWRQQYALSDTLFSGAAGEHMMLTADFKYLINGFCYYPDSGSVEPKYLRPLIIKVDSTGDAAWELPWRYVNGESFHGESYRSIIDNNQTIYSCGRHIDYSTTPPGDRPTMLKTDAIGNEISYHDLVPDSWQAVFFNINWFQDSTIEIDGGWGMNPTSDGQIAVFKVDRNGNILDSANIMQSVYCFSDAIVDHDNKLFLVQGQHDANQWRTYAWKLNSNLEYDTLYTHPFVYDSLCPHPITSDTIPLDCIVVGIDEPFQNPETGKLKIYPNPARDVLHIEIPQQLKNETHSPVFNLTTVYHQWKSAILEIYDLFGRKMYSKEVLQAEKSLELDVSGWGRGMYVVRLVYNAHTVASAKVMVE